MKAILTYHSIDDSASPISVSPDAFMAHLRWLALGRVKVLGLDALIAHPDNGGDAVSLTFDDGFLNTREGIERLGANGLPATLFVVSGHVGRTNEWGGRAQAGIPTLPLLSWSDLEHLVVRGVHIAAHTRSHRRLTSLSGDELDDELLGHQEDLEARLGVIARHLAYPFGDLDAAVAARAGRYFEYGHTTDFRFLESAADPLRLPRLDMYYFRAPGALESWGSPGFLRRVAWYRTRRTLRARLLKPFFGRP